MGRTVEHFVTPMFIPMVFPLAFIGYIMYKMKDALEAFFKLIGKLFEIIPLIFNPKKFVDDLIFGVTYGIKTMMSGIASSISSASVSNPKKQEPDSIPKTCMPPSTINLIIMVLCPPLALVLHNGLALTNFFNVIVCIILTIKLYYFPGLIFAAMHILC